MIKELKELYDGYLIDDIGETDNPEEFTWYSDNNGNQFGIKTSQLSHNEQKLLELSFHSILSPQQTLSKRERLWHCLLFEDSPLSEPLEITNVHFTHFYIKQADFESEAYTELIRELYQNDISILWDTPQSGIIINEVEREVPNYNEIIDTITTELLIDFSLFIGQTVNHLSNAKRTYMIENELFKTCLTEFPKQKLYLPENIYPQILIDQLEKQYKEYFLETILKETKEDKELLNTIKVYLENNMNVSLAAKKLFIHRNSLQYRVDKFVEKTGIDVKQFDNAMSVYICLLSKKVENDKNIRQ